LPRRKRRRRPESFKEECAIYIAIDGGGTKTEYLLLNEAFEPVDSIIGGATNHERLPDSYDGVARAFRESIYALLERNGLSPQSVRGVAGGIAGADCAEQAEKLEQLLNEAGFAHAKICNDGFLPVMAECSGAAGIAYNCGTGVCCTAMDPQGKMTKIGGLDEWSDDAGGGVWILQKLFAAVYEDVMFGGRKTLLTQAYLKALNVRLERISEELDESLMTLKRDAEIQRQMIAAVFQAYESGDEAACAICCRMIERAADYISAAYRHSDFGGKQLEIVLSGSVLLKAATPRLLDEMKDAVERRLGQHVLWLTPQHTPVHGAAAWLKKQAE